MKPVVFPVAVRERLARIEQAEGITAEEIVQQAVEVWSHLRGNERQFVGLTVMRIIVDRHRPIEPKA